MKLQIAIDRGGTFTDVWYKNTGTGKSGTLKLLSEDPGNYKDAPFESIRRLIEKEIGIKQPVGTKIDFKHIDWIRMGTTVATNALLERRGEPCALVITQGFKDLLYIGNQSRPDIFDLKIRMPDMLYSSVIEVEERIVLPNTKCEMKNLGNEDYGRNGEKVIIHTPLNEQRLRLDLKHIYDKGINSIAVALAHSYIYPKHEKRIGEVANEIGFHQVSLSSEVMPMIKLVPRGFTVTADAYLTPCIRRYLDGFCCGFDGLDSDKSRILFMQSDGGLAQMRDFMGSRAILSGPAGGVVGYARTTFARSGGQPVVGFDMGGTSTDVSRYAGHFEHIFESVTAGVSLQAAQLDINTVAAGGGSRLFVRDGGAMLVVGPESAGAHPGPVSYRKDGGKLAITDANLVLGRLLEWRFPKIFGPGENETLDKAGAVAAMKELLHDSPALASLTVEQLALGFVKVANETMCRPIRSLTQARGFDTSRHTLACFGGAGGQHACAVARSLGMSRVFIHKYSGILSAYGLALADVVVELQEPCSGGGLNIESEYSSVLVGRLDRLVEQVKLKLNQQGFVKEDQINLEVFLNLRYSGTDCALMISGGVGYSKLFEKKMTFITCFLDRYQSEFGFTLTNRTILVDDIRVRGSGLSGISVETNVDERLSPASANKIEPEEITQVYYDQGWLSTPVFDLYQLTPFKRRNGPAIIIDKNSTILVEPDCTFIVNINGDVEINILSHKSQYSVGVQFDPIQLSIFSHRFMSIAEQMGKALQRTSVSTNIKERLDFSCALFGPDGGLVANAPHIPVHLGAMQYTVQYQLGQLGNKLIPGDVLLSNHPTTGGSHLPDLTVITPVFATTTAAAAGSKVDEHEITKPIFFLANRGHHADIGGSTPGSMPPNSKSIFEEGAVFKTFFLVKNGEFQEKHVIEALEYPAIYSGCSGARNISDNLSDLRAQVAANEKGRKLVLNLIEEYSLDVVQAYMNHIQANAELSVRNMLREIAAASKYRARNNNLVELNARDCMDTGSLIQLKVVIDIEQGSAVFDFTGTGPETITNLNTPHAVTQSCIIYCLRCMVGHDVPLNQGCLKPIKLIIPPQSLLSPSDNAAVVGGNVQTSQRIVDVIFRAFEACAASQGCMNNVTFGDGDVGYYETVAGGAGAGSNWNGRSGVHSHMTNTRITDLEILETRYPVILERFSLRPQSGGRGLFYGGDGIERRLMFRSPMTVSLLTERRVFSPYGLNGGQSGSRGQNLLMKFKQRDSTGDERVHIIDVGAKVSLEVEPGDTVCILTPGGGGWGRHVEEANNSTPPNILSSPNAYSIVRGSVYDYQQQQFSA